MSNKPKNIVIQLADNITIEDAEELLDEHDPWLTESTRYRFSKRAGVIHLTNCYIDPALLVPLGAVMSFPDSYLSVQASAKQFHDWVRISLNRDIEWTVPR